MRRLFLLLACASAAFAQAPAITQGPVVGNITRSSATFLWSTDIPATSKIKWGYSGSTGNSFSPPIYDDVTQIHYWYVVGMTGSTVVSYQVCSTANATETCSSTATFTTATQATSPADPTPPTPVDTPTVPTGTVHTVGADCSDPTTGLVAMWTAAARGDIVEIDPAITPYCAGSFQFPAKSAGPPYILTRVKDATANLGTRRVSSSDKSNMARMIQNSPNVNMAGTADPTPEACFAGSYRWRQGQANAWAMYRCNNTNPQAITAITSSGNLRITVTGHGLPDLHFGNIAGATGAGAATVNQFLYINVIDVDTIELHDYIGNGVRTATGAASGGTISLNQFELEPVTEGTTPPATCTFGTWWHKQAGSGAEDEYHRTYYCTATNELIPYAMNVSAVNPTLPVIDLVTNKANYVMFQGLSFEPLNLKGDAQQAQYMYQPASQPYGTMTWFFVGQSVDNHHVYWNQLLASCPDPDPSGVMIRCHGFSNTLDGAHISVRNSTFQGFQIYHSKADIDDGSAVVMDVFNGGPTEVVNNYIACAGICFYYSDEIEAVAAAGDLTFVQNTVESPDKYWDQSGSYLGNGLYWSQRHRVEFKRLLRGKLDGNIIKGGWVWNNSAAGICLCTRGGQAGPQVSDVSNGSGGAGNIVTTYQPGVVSSPGWTMDDVKVGDWMYFSGASGTCVAASQFWQVASVIDRHQITLTGLNCLGGAGTNISRAGGASNYIHDVLLSNNTFINNPSDARVDGHDQGPPPRQLVGPSSQRIKFVNNLSIGLDGGRVGYGAFSANPAVAPSGSHLVAFLGIEDLQLLHETVSSRTNASHLDVTVSDGGPSSGLRLENNIFTVVDGQSVTNDGTGQTPVVALTAGFVGLSPAYHATNNVAINAGGALSGYPSPTWFFNSSGGTFPWTDPGAGDYSLNGLYRASDTCDSVPGDCTTDGLDAGVDMVALLAAQGGVPDPCSTLSLSPTSATPAAAGGSASIGVTADGGCSWTASTGAGWITTSASGTGNGTAAYTVGVSSGILRSGSIAIAGRSFSVTQAAPIVPAGPGAISGAQLKGASIP